MSGSRRSSFLASSTPRPGRGLRIVRTLAQSPSSTVYELVDGRAQRFALKLVAGPDGAEAVRRFEAEASALRRVDSPYVVRVFDAFVRPGPIYALLEPLLVGPTLEAELARLGRLRPTVARRILLELLEGLEAIHRAGLVHREVCAENVILGREAGDPLFEERAMLIDLGLALPHGEGPTPGHIRCKPSGVSPEQILSGRLDARTDVYAAGALLHELLTGAPPFAEQSVAATLAAHLDRLPPLPGASDPSLAVFDGVIDTALAKRPDRRYASAADFARALCALELGPDAPAAGPAPRPAPRSAQDGCSQRGAREAVELGA